MFAARGIAVSFSVFVMVYCMLSVTVGRACRGVARRNERKSATQNADLLFGLRILPLVTAAVITAAFAIPSFLILEPRAIDEPLGAMPLVLAASGVLLGIFGLVNAGTAIARTSRAIALWTKGARPVESSSSVPVVRIFPAVPALTATGIIHPTVLLSGVAEFLLTGNELQSALNHEMAHVRRRDNLKKLLVRFVPFPGMNKLEIAWLEATEMAADDAAVSNSSEALDLAAALIKLSRLAPPELNMELSAGIVQGSASVVHARVERLIAWRDEHSAPRKHFRWYRLLAVLVTLAAIAVTYTHLLVHVHTATEWLVR